MARATEKRRTLPKMQNSGNEAKECLKTKDITFLNAANPARFAREFAQFGRQKERKQSILRKRAEHLESTSEARTVTNSRLHASVVTPVALTLRSPCGAADPKAGATSSSGYCRTALQDLEGGRLSSIMARRSFTAAARCPRVRTGGANPGLGAALPGS